MGLQGPAGRGGVREATRPRARMPAVSGGRPCAVVLGRCAVLAQEAEWAPPSAWPQCASPPGGHQIDTSIEAAGLSRSGNVWYSRSAS